MAIAITGCTVVGLKSRIEEKFPGGLEALSQQVPNPTCLADDDLWRCAFMAESEGVKFIGMLQDAGLESKRGPDPDIVLVNEFDQIVNPYCEWLQTAKIQKGVIAWRVGTNPCSVIASPDWSFEEGSGLIFSDSSRDDDLEFLRLEGSVSVYFNKQLGKEVYLGRTWPDANEVYKAASRIIVEHSVDPGSPKLEGESEAQVRVALSKLDELSLEMPDKWLIHWSLGKGRRAIGDVQGAYESFRAAYALHSEDEAVLREYAGSCLEIGLADEAVKIGQKAAALCPDNPVTLGNLACAYLYAARFSEAMTTVKAALKINPADETNLYLLNMISDVQSGNRPQPHTLFDVTSFGQSHSKSSPIEPFIQKRPFWKRWFLPLVIFSLLSTTQPLVVRAEPTCWGAARRMETHDLSDKSPRNVGFSQRASVIFRESWAKAHATSSFSGASHMAVFLAASRGGRAIQGSTRLSSPPGGIGAVHHIIKTGLPGLSLRESDQWSGGECGLVAYASGTATSPASSPLDRRS